MALSTWPTPQRVLSDPDVRRTSRGQSRGERHSSALSQSDVWWEVGQQPMSVLVSGSLYQAAADLVRGALAPLESLQGDWDSYGGRPVERRVVDFAEWFVPPLLVQGVPAPAFVPSSSGGLSLEWHRPDIELVVRLEGEIGSAPSAFFADDVSGEEWEDSLDAARQRVGEALARFLPGA